MGEFEPILQSQYRPLAPYVDLEPDFFSNFDPKKRKEIVNREENFYHELTKPYSLEDKVDQEMLKFKSFDTTDINVKFYCPKDCPDVSPAVIFIHGGGFITCSPETHNYVPEYLAAKARVRCFNIDYRLAPEYPFPTGLEDCYAVILEILKDSKKFNIDENRIVLCGDSSGGNFVAALTLMARDRKEFSVFKQVLIYPVTDLSNTIPSKSAKFFAPDSSDNRMPPYKEWYLPDPKEARNIYVSPVLAKNFKDLPPALFIQAGCDLLLDDGLIYANCLKNDGVVVDVKVYEGMPHAFILRTYDETFEALDKIVEFVKQFECRGNTKG